MERRTKSILLILLAFIGSPICVLSLFISPIVFMYGASSLFPMLGFVIVFSIIIYLHFILFGIPAFFIFKKYKFFYTYIPFIFAFSLAFLEACIYLYYDSFIDDATGTTIIVPIEELTMQCLKLGSCAGIFAIIIVYPIIKITKKYL